MERVSVVIPNWNGRGLLGACLDSLRRQTYRGFAVCVVDNGSADDSVRFLRQAYPEVQVLALPENRGFSAAMNAGFGRAGGEYLVALNNDTEADPRWLEQLVRVLDEHPDVGFCASKLLDFSRRDVIDSAGDGLTRAGIPFRLGAGERDVGQYDQLRDVLSARAAAAAYRRSMLEATGMFDEDFVTYLEDLDLGIRARLLGYRGVFVPTAVVYHRGGATSGASPSAATLHLTVKNAYQVLIKNMPFGLLVQMLPLSVAVQLALTLESFLTRRREKFRRARAGFVSGFLAAVRELPRLARKRAVLQGSRRVTSGALGALIPFRVPRGGPGRLAAPAKCQ